MAWRLIKQPNGLYARFSEVVDNVTDYDMTAHEAFVLCVEEYGMMPGGANKKIEAADAEPKRFEEALGVIERVHGVVERAKVVAMCSEI